VTTPEKIHFERVLAGLGCMGIENVARTVRRVVIDPEGVTVERYRLNEEGNRYLEPDTGEVAVEIVLMPIDYPRRPLDTGEAKS